MLTDSGFVMFKGVSDLLSCLQCIFSRLFFGLFLNSESSVTLP